MGEEVCPKVKFLGIVWVSLIELLFYLVERLYEGIIFEKDFCWGLGDVSVVSGIMNHWE